MSVAAAMRAMLAAGLTIEQALVAVEAFEAHPLAPTVSSGALRQRRLRARQAEASQTVTRDACDESDACNAHPSPSSSETKVSPTPPSKTQPSPTPSPPIVPPTPETTPQRRAELALLAETIRDCGGKPEKPTRARRKPVELLTPIAEQAWLAFPQRGRERSSTKLVAEVWPEASERAGGEDKLLAAVQAYARSDRDVKGDAGAKGMHRWLADARFESWLGAASIAAPAAAFDGPAELRAAVAQAEDENFARAYLDPCHWQAEPPILFARTGIAADTLRKRCGPILGRFGVNVQQQVRT